MRSKMHVRSYKELAIWTKGIEIVDNIYKLTKKFPNEEKFGLATQMNRSAISIPSNIAEGFARSHSRQFTQFLRYSLGSCAELETQLIVASRQHHITETDFLASEDLLDHESRMIMSFMKKLKLNFKNPNPSFDPTIRRSDDRTIKRNHS